MQMSLAVPYTRDLRAMTLLSAGKQAGTSACLRRAARDGDRVAGRWQVGEAERNVRALFWEAEREWKEKGERSALHIIILDEIDAIARRRGSLRVPPLPLSSEQHSGFSNGFCWSLH